MSDSLRRGVRRIIFRWGWDTRIRHRDPVRLLRRLSQGAVPLTVLDAGSGAGGLAAFMPHLPVLGVDLATPATMPANMAFAVGSVTQLPAADHAYDVVTSIDVFEYLSPEDRQLAVAEMLRVARRAILVSAPDGHVARAADATYRAALARRGRPVPEWITGAEPFPYPTADDVVAAIQALDPQMHIERRRSEPLAVTRILRFIAARSTTAYIVANLLLGTAAALVPRRGAAYRFLILATFTQDRAQNAP